MLTRPDNYYVTIRLPPFPEHFRACCPRLLRCRHMPADSSPTVPAASPHRRPPILLAASRPQDLPASDRDLGIRMICRLPICALCNETRAGSLCIGYHYQFVGFNETFAASGFTLTFPVLGLMCSTFTIRLQRTQSMTSPTSSTSSQRLICWQEGQVKESMEIDKIVIFPSHPVLAGCQLSQYIKYRLCYLSFSLTMALHVKSGRCKILTRFYIFLLNLEIKIQLNTTYAYLFIIKNSLIYAVR